MRLKVTDRTPSLIRLALTAYSAIIGHYDRLVAGLELRYIPSQWQKRR